MGLCFHRPLDARGNRRLRRRGRGHRESVGARQAARRRNGAGRGLSGHLAESLRQRPVPNSHRAATGSAAGGRPRNVARQGRDGGGNFDELSAHRAIFCLVARFGNPSDQNAVGRGNRRDRVCRKRNSEALVSEQLRRAAHACRLRTRGIARSRGQCAARRRGGRRAAFGGAIAGGHEDDYSGQLAARPADSRIHRPSDRAGPRARHGSQFRGHEFSDARKNWASCGMVPISSM